MKRYKIKYGRKTNCFPAVFLYLVKFQGIQLGIQHGKLQANGFAGKLAKVSAVLQGNYSVDVIAKDFKALAKALFAIGC